MHEKHFAFDSEEYAARFEQNRALPSRVARFWADYVTGRAFASCPAGREPSILDIGCGTGRFSVLFSRKGCAVTGIDRSPQMIRYALSHATEMSSSNLRFTQCDIYDDFGSAKFDVVFLSEVIHLIEDVEMFFHRCYSLLSDGGSLVVRTASKEQASKRDFLRFFPSALALEVARHHNLSTIEAALRSSRLDDNYCICIEEGDEADKANYITSVSERFHSVLHLIDREEFETGLGQLRIATPESLYLSFPTTLLHATKHD